MLVFSNANFPPWPFKLQQLKKFALKSLKLEEKKINVRTYRSDNNLLPSALWLISLSHMRDFVFNRWFVMFYTIDKFTIGCNFVVLLFKPLLLKQEYTPNNFWLTTPFARMFSYTANHKTENYIFIISFTASLWSYPPILFSCFS